MGDSSTMPLAFVCIEGLRDIDAMMMLQGVDAFAHEGGCLRSPRLMICGIAGSVLAAHEVWSIDPVDELRVQALLSVAQNLVSTPWLTQLLRRCAALAPSLELMLVGWASKPPRGVADPDNICQTRPRVRISTAALEFVSPCHFVRKESGHYAALAGLDPVRLIFGTNDDSRRCESSPNASQKELSPKPETGYTEARRNKAKPALDTQEMARKRALYFERSCKVW
ncbi:hypothetical protein AK812_SmicGene25778 [Symbiodinium microadriaticum]|uniref:Uncharacterized protein n=1 Tax=Symbiodinium microadriaticum TaxID=2951 RepID=A0A1Q9DBE3_SYMMI|nr:hypothetical protein AK812_SmicGene25778 [Symbiodinium microadriaticum]